MSAWYRLFSRRVGLPAPVVAKVSCDRDVRIPLGDGVETVADHWKPVGVSSPPLVLIRSPYGRKLFNLLIGRHLAHQGFQVVIQASRGTDGSAGRFDNPFACEIEDGAATVRWLVEQPWYPGRFFTFGDSYLGYTQLALAASAGEHLAGQVLRVAPSSVHRMIWPGDALLVKAIVSWGLMAHRDPTLGLGSLVRGKLQDKKLDAALTQAPLLSSYRALSDEPIPFLEEWLKHPGNDDGWWDGSEVGSALDAITCPVLVQGGWYDLFLDDSLMQYQRLAARGVPVELKLGPWTHGEMLTKGLAATLTDATAWLREQAGLEPRSPGTKPVRLVEINSRADVALDDWPAAPPAALTYGLASGGRLTEASDEGSTSFRYDPSDPTPRVGGASNDDASGSKDNTQLESRPDVVTFTSQPLAAETHLLGNPVVALCFASDRSDTAVFVRLCEVTAEGTSMNITDRLVSLRADDRGDDGTWQLEVALPATCISLPAGHRFRLQVSSGAFPRFARHPGTAEPVGTATDYLAASQTVHHATSLRLPLAAEPAGRPASASAVSA